MTSYQSHLLSLEDASPPLTALVLFPTSVLPKDGTAPQSRPAADSPSVETAIEMGRRVADIESYDEKRGRSSVLYILSFDKRQRYRRTNTCGDG